MPSNIPFEAEEQLAWAQIRIKRLCPPLSLLLAKNETALKHLENCSYCREKLELYQDIDDLIPDAEKPGTAINTIPKPGEIRSITGIDPVCEGVLYNPPLVVVLDEPDAEYGFLRVAQVFDEPALADKGDINLQLPDADYFAESWNTYPMLPKFLGPSLGKAQDETVTEILALAEEPLPEVQPDSPIEAFRELEIDIGYHFNDESYNESLKAIEDTIKEPNENISAEKEEKQPAKVIPFRSVNADLQDDQRNNNKSFSAGFPAEAVLGAAAGAAAESAASAGDIKSKIGTSPKKNRTYFKKIIVPFAACLCLMAATFWYNSKSDAPVPENSKDKPLIAVSSKSRASQSASVKSDFPPMDFSQIFALLAQGGTDSLRGSEQIPSLPWEDGENIKNISNSWKAFAAGQWEARNKLAPSNKPFPRQWLLEEGASPSAWAKDPYYNLGILAFLADNVCKLESGNSEPPKERLASLATALIGKMPEADATVTDFLNSLKETPMSCPKIGDYLDEFDNQLR